MKASWILNGGIEEEWESYLQKMEDYGLSSIWRSNRNILMH